MTSNNPDLGEQALSKVAEVGIASQLDGVEELTVDIRTNPGKLIQGEVDSVAISGKGMVMKQDLRMESIEVQTAKVSINPLSAIFGNVELDQPADADAQIVLTEEDLNRAIASDYIASKLQGLKLKIEEQVHTVKLQEANIQLLAAGTMSLDISFLLEESNEAKTLLASVIQR